MSLQLQMEEDKKLMVVHLSGKLQKSDYAHFAPAVDEVIEKDGKIRMLVEMQDFHGWTPGGVWEDTKFGARHFSDIERLAIVGDKTWERWMATFCKPFTRAAVKYFPIDKQGEARSWVMQN
ncbi:MAG TPA: STAS/SEC14 domain-containing protein [Humisphaera sp.]|nr:STAS/SEC14 domain-containing protein [Humisphaera sp.]